MASPPQQQQQQQQQQQPCPLFDWFLDLPHPAASKSCPGPFLIPSPVVPNPMADEIQTILPQIARFAFPEHDESIESSPPSTSPHQQQPASSVASDESSFLVLNRHDVSATQNDAGSQQHFAFSLQLQTGARVHGHVRRYLPPHLTARTRYDVGRRGERALVLLTRATGADLLYTAILKSVEAISSQQAALSSTGKALHAGNPQQWFLHQLSRYQIHLSQVYERQPPNERGKPLIASIPNLEFGDHHIVLRTKYKDFDTNRFIIPVSLLVPVPTIATTSSSASSPAGSIVPLLRCVGVAHALRIMAALLSERRVILVSNSPTRLAVCSNAAVSLLAVGLLHWQHLYIPVLPPHMWQYLAAPYPYLIGILTSTAPRLDRTDGLGEVLIIHLDTNQMETRGMETGTIQQRLPDLFRAAADQIQQQIPHSVSASETLAQDLFELLKQDKKVLYGESTFNKVGETAAIATKVVKNTFFKLRDKGRQYLAQRNQMGGEEAPVGQETTVDEDTPVEVNSMASDYIYTEGCHNEVAEQEARIAFTSFFLCMYGDMRWYLSTTPTGPVLDRAKYLQQKRAMGDGEGTPMWLVLNNFCQTQMLEEFSKARMEEVRTRAPVTADMPLFLQCAAYCRQHNMDFNISTMQRIPRQIAETSPTRLTGLLQTNARRTAMTLTSNKAYEGDYLHSIAQLVEQCRESTSILFDVMSVIWLRLRDCRGMQWKHGFQALQILRNLLYHGPMAAITEATDGLSKIRAMKSYDNIRTQSTELMRNAAATVYDLLVDRARLFQVRRVCADRRRLMQSKTEPKRIREANTRIGVPFLTVHAYMHPNAASGTVVSIPPKAPSGETMSRGNVEPQHRVAAPNVDLLDNSGAGNDLMGLFGNIDVSSHQGGSSPSTTNSNLFDAFASSNPSKQPVTVPQNPPMPQIGHHGSAQMHPQQQMQTQVAVPQNPTMPQIGHQGSAQMRPQQQIQTQVAVHSTQTHMPQQYSPIQPQAGVQPGQLPQPLPQSQQPPGSFQQKHLAPLQQHRPQQPFPPAAGMGHAGSNTLLTNSQQHGQITASQGFNGAQLARPSQPHQHQQGRLVAQQSAQTFPAGQPPLQQQNNPFHPGLSQSPVAAPMVTPPMQRTQNGPPSTGYPQQQASSNYMPQQTAASSGGHPQQFPCQPVPSVQQYQQHQAVPGSTNAHQQAMQNNFSQFDPLAKR